MYCHHVYCLLAVLHTCCVCRLGMHLDAALEEAATTLTPPLLDAWLASERQRQAAQWQPRRAGAAAGQGPEGSSSQEEEEEEEEAEHRTVAWREVRPYLWRFGEWCTGAAAAWLQTLPACVLHIHHTFLSRCS